MNPGASIKEIRETEIIYCSTHLEYFIETYGHIEDKDADDLIQPFRLWDSQKEALRSIRSHRKNVILKSRQLGISWLVIHIAAHLLLTDYGKTVVSLSRTEDEAKELIRRLKVVFANMPALIADAKEQPPGWNGPTFTTTAMDLTVTFPGKHPVSVMKAFPSSPNAGRSFTANLVIIDEWAFQDWAEDIWKAVYPAINRPQGGWFIGLSTIKRGSLFERTFTDEGNGFNKIFLPWSADPRRTPEWYAETKRSLGDAITEEYPATIEEALTVPGGSYFPEVSKDHTISGDPLKGPLLRYVTLDYGLDMFSAHWICVDTKGNAQVYREYDAPDMTISQCAEILMDLTGDEKLECYLAPSDLWYRSQVTGKSRAQLWAEAGIVLTQVSRDFRAGCAGMKEWLRPQENGKSKLTILKGAAPNLYNSLKKIQKDDKEPDVYAKKPHNLTHDPDSLRYFCTWWTLTPSHRNLDPRRHKWTKDLFEDFERADEETRARMVARYGEPVYEDLEEND